MWRLAPPQPLHLLQHLPQHLWKLFLAATLTRLVLGPVATRPLVQRNLQTRNGRLQGQPESALSDCRTSHLLDLPYMMGQTGQVL